MSQVLVVGRGRLGRSLMRALTFAGVPVELLPGRDWQAASAALRRVPGSLAFLAVPDQFLGALAARFAVDGGLPGGGAFVHLSGGLGLAVLAPLAEAGHAVGCFHPLQPFPNERGPEAFRGSVCSLDADDEALYAELERLTVALGAIPRRLTERWRPLYHAAAVMASSYVVTLAAQATSMLQAAGWSRQESLQALLPLMRGTLDNLESQGLPGGLSGPMRRGDGETVLRHIEAIESTSGLLEETSKIYRLLGQGTLGLAAETGLSPTEIGDLRRALAEHSQVWEVRSR